MAAAPSAKGEGGIAPAQQEGAAAASSMGTGSNDDDPKLQAVVAAWEWDSSTVPMSPEAPLLPFWVEVDEQPEHQGIVLGFHTQPCSDFQSGYCSYHRPRGKTSPCFCYHFDSQRRRPPIDTSTGRLQYWDVPCHGMNTEDSCSNEDSCVFAHSHEEISYHPAKYKTRRCNGRGCRGEAICCFAHSEAELRVLAPQRYSYWMLVSGQTVHASACSKDWSSTPAVGSSSGSADTSRRLGSFCRTAQPPSMRHKQRFCASFPDVSQCRRGAACAFAHSREEARTPLLSVEQEQQEPVALTEEFFMYQFKTLWCPIGVQHDWQTCVYAHNYQDARRQVSIGYGPRPCPYWAKKDVVAEYSQRCPLGLRCPFSHGAKEQLYHPQYFRTVICRDLRAKACPRQKLCAFFHRRAERRKPPADNTNYSMPLVEEALPESWITDFLSPPFRDAAGPSSAAGLAEGAPNEGAFLEGEEAYWCAAAAAYGLGASMLDPGGEEHDGNHVGGIGSETDHKEGCEEDEAAYHEFIMRLSMLPQLVAKAEGARPDAEGTPRTQTGESDPADDSSTCTSRPEPLAANEKATGGARSAAVAAGAVGASFAAASGCPSSTAELPEDHTPWKVKAPSYGPFSGPFHAFPGFLATSNTASSQSHTSSWWEGAHAGAPRMVL